jgi:signal transduction histidine kinase
MDSSQFDQIFLNLVVNARDAMPNGGALQMSARVLITERTNTDVLWHRFESAPADRVVSIEVRDTGAGIPSDVIDRIFEPFYSTKGDRGTGLGLATVLSVVRGVLGAVDVSSTVGVGSTFIVQLPLIDVAPGVTEHTRQRVLVGV